MTEDPAVMVPNLEGLTPDVMPQEGALAADAPALAADLLGQEDAPGGVLFVADGIDPADAAALDAEPAPPVAVLSTLPDSTRDRGLDGLSALVVPVTPDDGDVRQIDRALNAVYRQAMLENAEQPWQDRGHWPA